MYEKNLKNRVIVRLSDDDLEFIHYLSKARRCNYSKVIRDLIGDYRRQFNLSGGYPNANFKTDKHN